MPEKSVVVDNSDIAIRKSITILIVMHVLSLIHVNDVYEV